MMMDDDLCHLCFESCAHMKYSFQNSAEHTNIQEFIDAFCQLVFQSNICTFDTVCAKCLRQLQQFSQYCEKIRSIHRDLGAQRIEEDEESKEILFESVEYNVVEPECENQVQILAIETDTDADGSDTIGRRPSELTPRVIARLEEQLKFDATTVDLSEIDFNRFARFIPMDCTKCNLQYDSFEDYNDHFLFAHQRSAVWNCCNLVLETPYDALDHLKYHESIEHFKCAACFKCFLSSTKLKYHIRRTHLPVDGMLSCTECNKQYKNLRLLLNHQRSHIQINCTHCSKDIAASNYEQHVRAIHASIGDTKRKSPTKADGKTAKKRKSDGQQALPSTSKKPSSTTNVSIPLPKSTQIRTFAVNNEPNENGMFECDLCRMEFKQISLVYSHRNKVHV